MSYGGRSPGVSMGCDDSYGDENFDGGAGDVGDGGFAETEQY